MPTEQDNGDTRRRTAGRGIQNMSRDGAGHKIHFLSGSCPKSVARTNLSIRKCVIFRCSAAAISNSWLSSFGNLACNKANNSVAEIPEADEEIVESLKSLEKVRHMSGRVFLRDGQPMNSIRKAFNTAKRKAGLDSLVFHDLRGIAATNLLRAMGDQKLAMSITGHKTPAVFQRYVRVTEERQKELMDRMTKMVKQSEV